MSSPPRWCGLLACLRALQRSLRERTGRCTTEQPEGARSCCQAVLHWAPACGAPTLPCAARLHAGAAPSARPAARGRPWSPAPPSAGRAPLSLPLSLGSTSATALAAPVDVGTMLSAAQVAVARVQQPLVAGVAVRGGHRALDDAELLVQHLRALLLSLTARARITY
jgi:hypothetical protein